MAEPTSKTDVFKFVALRPPTSLNKKSEDVKFIKDTRLPEQTPVGELVKTFDKKDGTRIPEQIKAYLKDKPLALDYPENIQDYTLKRVHDITLTVARKDFSADILSDNIKQVLDREISSFLNEENTISQLHTLWDSYYAFYMLSRTQNCNLDALTRNLKMFHLLKNLNDCNITDYSTFQLVISAQPLIDKLFTNIPKPLVKIEEPVEKQPDPEKIKEYKEIWNELINTHRAIEEIQKVKFETKISTQTQEIKVSDQETGNESKVKQTFIKSNISVNKKSFARLNPATKSFLSKMDFNQTNFQLAEPLMQLQTKLQHVYYTANQIEDIAFFKLMPQEAKGVYELKSFFQKFNSDMLLKPPSIKPASIRASIKPLGIGDLKVVKQKIKKYVAGEVAHIENVLRGEYKERKHRVLDRTEDIYTTSSETNEETIRDTQTTERFELKKESEKTIQEQMSVQAGVTVSASYGPVTFGAHGDFAYSTSTQESNKSSSNFAREVVDKSVSKIQKKTKEERTIKRLHEVEEINTHGIDNKDKPDHAVGIYRWVDKYYEAQIYNYGKRMMFEFIIPEPAAFYEYAKNNKPKKAITPPKELNKLLTHKDINPYNYQDFIRDYNVQGVSLPPAEFKVVSAVLSSDAKIENGTALTKSSKDLVVPEGYTLHSLSFSLSAIYQNYPQCKLSIGANDLAWATLSNNHASKKWDVVIGSLTSSYDSIVPISINCYDLNSFFVNVSAVCIRTDAKYEQWQIQTYEKIRTAHKALVVEYEQKVAQQETQQGIAITGQNPRINREIEKTELKKQCIKMLMDTYLFGSFDAMKADGIYLSDGKIIPDFDIFDALKEGKTIQFFEQAFEWENLTYLFYPYFWARKEQWIAKSNTYDTDPLFTQFLQAGSARVVLPVHPAYNDAVMYFLENNGAIWKGGEPPRLNDPLFISLADELKDQTDDLAGATPEGEPWEVILPTTLVYLQENADLPTF